VRFWAKFSQHLYCLIHVDGGPIGWQLFDISPGQTVSAFDVIKDSKGIIHLAAAVTQSSGTSVVYHASYSIPSLVYDPNAKAITGFDSKGKSSFTPLPRVSTFLLLVGSISWTAISNNMGPKLVSYLKCGISGPPIIKSAAFQVIAGTVAQADVEASHYTIDPSPEVATPWKNIYLPESASKIIEIQPAVTNDGNGLYTLYERVDGSIGCVADILDPQTASPLASMRILLANIGDVKSIFASLNPWG